MSEPRRFAFVVEETEAGGRFDRFLAARIPDVSRSRLAELIKSGGALLDGRAAKPSEPVEAGWTATVEVPPLEEKRLEPADLPLALLYEDDDLLVLTKPAGLVVHPGAGETGPTLAAALLNHVPEIGGVGGPGRAGLVHRLDKGTTGAMVVAKTEAAHAALQRQFAAREVEKLYHTIVWGRPAEDEAEIDLPVGRDPSSRIKMSTRPLHGRAARSLYRVRGAVPGFAWLEVRIYTGRTHQVRVHMAAIGHPVVGDDTYGGRREASVHDQRKRHALHALDRPLLHAVHLAFAHPRTGARMVFEAPWPADMRAAWEVLGGVPFELAEPPR